MNKALLSKTISFALRHKPESFGLVLDENGYAEVKQLINNLNACGKKIDFEILKEIVVGDEKNGFRLTKTKAGFAQITGTLFP